MLFTCQLASADQFRIQSCLPTSPFRYTANTTVTPVHAQGSDEIPLDSQDMAILATVNRHMVLTAYQIRDIFDQMGAKTNGYGEIFRRMDRLVSVGLLEKFEYSTPVTTGRADAFYRLGKRGSKLLYSKGIRSHLLDYLTGTDLVRHFRILSVNQFLIKQHLTDGNFTMAQSVLVKDRAEQYNVRPQCVFQAEKTYLIEAVRTQPDWEEELSKKLYRWESLLNCRSAKNIRLEDPALVLIGESAHHCRKIMELTVGRNLDLIYTADDLVYTNPHESLYTLPKVRSIPNPFRSLKSWL